MQIHDIWYLTMYFSELSDVSLNPGLKILFGQNLSGLSELKYEYDKGRVRKKKIVENSTKGWFQKKR